MYPSAGSSPHAQTVGSSYGLAVSQQKAALASKHLQEPFCGLAPNPAVVDGPNKRPLTVHTASDARPHVRKCSRLSQHKNEWKVEMQEKLFWFSHLYVLQLLPSYNFLLSLSLFLTLSRWRSQHRFTLLAFTYYFTNCKKKTENEFQWISLSWFGGS